MLSPRTPKEDIDEEGNSEADQDKKKMQGSSEDEDLFKDKFAPGRLHDGNLHAAEGSLVHLGRGCAEAACQLRARGFEQPPHRPRRVTRLENECFSRFCRCSAAVSCLELNGGLI